LRRRLQQYGANTCARADSDTDANTRADSDADASTRTDSGTARG
jgi:hypothetical protein